ncbi:MAG TPA: glucan biosynthesis protein G [Candidatus Binatia bacterium]|nr:glucan biosynthesis protein G [Candidatus Binatia bacterium]
MKYPEPFDMRTSLIRRPLGIPSLVALAFFCGSGTNAFAAFDMSRVAAYAEELAKAPFKDPAGAVPKWLLDVSYDQWRDIRFRPDRSLWLDGKQRFTVQFFHPGLYYDRVVGINVVDDRGVRQVPFSPSQFDYGKNDFASRVPQNLGYAGFRVHYPINRPDYRDEVIVFVGGSYFRALGKDLTFGLSARGLAIDTALPSGEEFPYFKEFWLVRPAADATEMVVYALLDSARITGAYRFLIRPGEQTVVEVQAKFYARKEIAKVGIAPLTSMFFHGENTLVKYDDFRPEVHDSDGLLLWFSTGEWLWRPLDNPESLGVSSFHMPSPKGFGLLQRDRDFDHYQELETHSEARPSAWVIPRGDWGDGHVELVEIPTKNEVNDNIVAYWVPEKGPQAGGSMSFAYDLYWYRDDRDRPPGGRAVATRRDHGTVEGANRLIIDFEGARLKELPAETVVRGVITVGSGKEIGEELVGQHVVKNTATGGWRLGFQIRPKDKKPIELRAFLQKGDETLTETWSYTLQP